LTTVDKLDNTVANGDIVVQGGEWGIWMYRVRRDPEETKRLHVHDINGNHDTVISKNPRYILNLSTLLGTMMSNEEIEELVKQKEDDA